jgi:hypothetical protein
MRGFRCLSLFHTRFRGRHRLCSKLVSTSGVRLHLWQQICLLLFIHLPMVRFVAMNARVAARSG